MSGLCIEKTFPIITAAMTWFNNQNRVNVKRYIGDIMTIYKNGIIELISGGAAVSMVRVVMP